MALDAWNFQNVCRGVEEKIGFRSFVCVFFFIRVILAAFASHFFAHWDGNGTWNCAKAPFAHDNSYTYNTKSWTINSLSNMLIIFVGCPFFSTSVRWRISFLCIIHGLDFRVFILSFEHWFFKTVSAVFFFRVQLIIVRLCMCLCFALVIHYTNTRNYQVKTLYLLLFSIALMT